jgi:bacteriorhodopsin
LALPSRHRLPLSPFTLFKNKSGDRLKTTDTTPRVIFLPRYADLLLTQPLLLATIGLMSKADTSVMVSLVG